MHPDWGWFHPFWPSKDIVYRVSAKDIRGVSASGSAEISDVGTIETSGLAVNISGSGKMDLNLTVQKVAVQVSGSGNIVLSGSAGEVDLTASGSAQFDARRLAAATCEVHISGSGNAQVNVSRSLTVNISGAGHVLYSGNPQVQSHISGSGSVEQVGQ